MRDVIHPPTVKPGMPVGRAPHGPIRFSLNGVPERDRPEVFREFFGRAVIRVDVEPMRDVPFDADLKLQALPGLQLATGRMQGSRNRRTSALAADGIDDIAVIMNLKGPYQISHGGQDLVLGEGDATLISCEEGGSLTHQPPGEVLAVRIPRARFAQLVTGANDCFLRQIPRDTQALKLLRNYIDLVWDDQTIASRDLQHLVVAHVCDLVAVTVGATREAAEVAEGRGLRAARLHAIKQDIARNLDQPDLSVATLAVRHGCTPRFIQRLFEVEGTTFTEYVLAQRLVRAHRMLNDPRRAGDKIATIALDAGFSDVSYFNRAFRQVYGDTPSSIRATFAPSEARRCTM